MFYSHDLLGRKTPLGAIWTLAHGRKLSKGRIISINLREICDEILAPNVPHSLRLQGILIGGVVIVYNKQQAYLLEDLQEMMKRVKAAGRQPVANKAGDEDAAPSSKAATKAGSKRKKDRLTADIKDITVMDMDDLMGGDAAFFNDSAGDFLGLMGPLSSAFSSGSGGLGGLARAGHLRNNQLLEPAEGGDDLFTMPSMDGETSEATRTTSNTQGGGRKGSKAGSRSRSVTFASGEAIEQQHPHQQQQQQPEEEEVYGGLGPNAHDWNLDEEMFDDVQYDLLDFMPQQPQPPPPAAAAAAAAADSEQTASARAASGAAQPGSTTTSGSELRGPPAAPLDDAMELDDQQLPPPPDTDEQLPGEERTPGASGDGGDDVAAAARDQRASAEAGQEAAAPKRAKRAAGARKARSRKRRADQAFLDDPDQLEIKSEVYRRWIADPSGLVNQELRAKSTASAVALAASRAPPLDPCSLLDPGHPLMMGGNMLPAGLSMLAPMGNMTLCPELLELYRAPAALMQSPAAATGKKARGKAKAAPETPDSPEVNNSTGEGQLPHVQRVHRQPLPLEHVSGLPSTGRQAAGDEQQGDFPPEHDQEQEQDMLSNDEAHDQLMELPFGADIEVERLRAANTPSTGSLHMSSPGATGTAARLRQSASRRAGSSTSNDSALRPMQLDDEVQSGAAGLAALRTSNSHQDDDGLFFGTGNLADLLPDVELPPDEQQQHRSDGWQPDSSDRLLDGGASGSQFPLLEETEPSQPTQAGTQLESGLVTQASRLVLSIFRDRLQRADRAAGDDGVSEGSAGGGGAAAPSISMFDVMRDGRLSRSQAAKLFYQVCVTSSVGFIRVEQERPFADIMIAAGPSM